MYTITIEEFKANVMEMGLMKVDGERRRLFICTVRKNHEHHSFDGNLLFHTFRYVHFVFLHPRISGVFVLQESSLVRMA